MAWHQFSVITSEQLAPRLAEALDDLGAVSVTYMDAEDEPVYEPALGETKIWTNTQVIALFDLEADLESIEKQMFTQFDNTQLLNWCYQYIEDQEWERAWMEYYQPMKFADRLWVCPTGQEQLESGTVCLLLDPGLAFGTGTHPTTALCLEWLAGHDLTGKIVIDYGCGSGILAIAAVLLGARAAYAVDIDPQAITATLDNALKNKVDDRIYCYLVEQFVPFQADVVVANILANPLIEMAESISDLVLAGGDLLLSGILAEQSGSVIHAYQEKVIFTEPVQREDWVRLHGTRLSR